MINMMQYVFPPKKELEQEQELGSHQEEDDCTVDLLPDDAERQAELQKVALLCTYQ